MNAGGRKMPMLITENYGRGRTAVLATGGTWRWQMSHAAGRSEPRRVLAAIAALGGDGYARATWLRRCRARCFSMTGAFAFRPTCATRNTSPLPDAQVEAHIIGPEAAPRLPSN